MCRLLISFTCGFQQHKWKIWSVKWCWTKGKIKECSFEGAHWLKWCFYSFGVVMWPFKMVGGWSLKPHLKEFNIWTAGLLTRRCAQRGHSLCLVPFPLAGTQRRSGITLFPPAERDVKRGQSLSLYLITLPQDSQRAPGRGVGGVGGGASELGSVCPGNDAGSDQLLSVYPSLPRSQTCALIWQTSRSDSRQRDLNHTCSENKHGTRREFCLIQLHIKASPLGRPSASPIQSTV